MLRMALHHGILGLRYLKVNEAVSEDNGDAVWDNAVEEAKGKGIVMYKSNYGRPAWDEFSGR